MSAAEAQEDDAALKHGELASLASIHAAAYKPSAIVGQFTVTPQWSVPGSSPPTPKPDFGAWPRQSSGRRKAPRHQPLRRSRTHRPDLLSIHSVTAKTEALLGCMRRSRDRSVATVDDFEVDILFHEAVENFTASDFRHHSLWTLLRDDSELADTLRAFFEASLDVAECAQRMKLHKNTVYYRISKVGRATGLNFSDPRHSLVALLHIQEWAGKQKEHLGKK